MLFACVVHVLRLTTHALTLIACPQDNMSRKCVERTTWFEMCNMFVEHMYYSLSRVLVIWFQHNCTIIPLPSRYLTSMKLFFGGNTLTTNPLQTLVKQFDPTLTARSSSMLSFFQWRRSVLPPHESRDQKRHTRHTWCHKTAQCRQRNATKWHPPSHSRKKPSEKKRQVADATKLKYETSSFLL